MPIRLTQTPTTCRVRPVAGIKRSKSRRPDIGKQPLKLGKRLRERQICALFHIHQVRARRVHSRIGISNVSTASTTTEPMLDLGPVVI